jgi:DNA-binding NarL/FixJ family response regulator
VEGTVSVLVADDDVGTRQGIRLNLADAGLDVRADAADAATVIASVRDAPPDVCLIGLNLSGGGLRTAAWICANAPDTAVLLVADAIADDELFDALRVGAAGFVMRGMNGDRLPQVIRGVARGEMALPRDLATRVARQFREHRQRRLLTVGEARGAELTGREWEVLELLRAGARTREIAERLGIAQVTVRRHISEALKKLAVESRADAVALLEKCSSSS